jgi:hypothetical protein
MKQLMKRGMAAGLLVLAVLMALGTAAQACRVEDEPGGWRRGDRDLFGHAFLADRMQRGFRPADGEDDEDWKRPGRFWNFGRPERMHRSLFDRPMFGWVPFDSFGTGWKDRLKDWNLDQILDRIDENPAVVFFGGFMRPMFVALVFPLGDGNGGGSIEPPPNGTPTPVPAAALLLATGLAGLGALRLKQRRAQG